MKNTIKVQFTNINGRSLKKLHISVDLIKKKIDSGAELKHFKHQTSIQDFFVLREKLQNGDEKVWFLDSSDALKQFNHATAIV